MKQLFIGGLVVLDCIKMIVLSIEMALYANLWRLFYAKCAKKRITCHHTKLLSER